MDAIADDEPAATPRLSRPREGPERASDGVDIPAWARRAPEPSGDAAPVDRPRRPRIVIVGPCAAGKSTLGAALTAEGYTAGVCAQEHSNVPQLWALSEPDLLIYLAVSLAAIRARRSNPGWPASIYEQQLRRLDHARRHATVVIDTSEITPEEVRALARAAIARGQGSGIRDQG